MESEHFVASNCRLAEGLALTRTVSPFINDFIAAAEADVSSASVVSVIAYTPSSSKIRE